MSIQQDIVKEVDERGFVMVAVIVLLAILTIFAAGALFKSNIQVKVSASSVESEQALAAANAGLNQTYIYWKYDQPVGGKAELTAVSNAIIDPANTTPIYKPLLVATSLAMPSSGNASKPDANSLAALMGSTSISTAIADIDNYLRSGNGIRIYDITSAGVTVANNSTWAKVKHPQVAVWATSFGAQSEPAYPYQTPNNAACSDCDIVVYALGASGNARSLVREHLASIQSTFSSSGLGSINNAYQ